MKPIPGPLVAVSAGIGLNYLFTGMEGYELEAEHLVSIPVPENFAGFFNQFSLPDFTQWDNPQIYVIGITIAVVASLETLLCVEATDKLDPQKRITPTNRELIAQGIGNMFSGFIGGLPITQVIVRSFSEHPIRWSYQSICILPWNFAIDYGHGHSKSVEHDSSSQFGCNPLGRGIQTC